MKLSILTPILAALLLCIAPTNSSCAEESFTIVQLCDTQLGMGGYEHDLDSFNKAVVQINALAPDMVFICGDLVDQPKDQSFKDFKEILAKFTVPCYPAPGNHDVGSMPTKASLEKYRKTIGKDYYTVQHKGYNFIIVNTQLWKKDVPEASEKHHNWFKKTLKESHAQGLKNIIVGHYPIFVNSHDEEDQYYNLPIALRKEILYHCINQGVVAYLAGHVHKNLIREFQGIPMVASATSSKNFDGAPMGFRIWTLKPDGKSEHKYIEIEGLDPSLDPKKTPK